MRCTIPEISWHNRDPVLSIDIQPQHPSEDFYRLATGGTDSHVIIWHVRVNAEEVSSIEAAADLVRHQKAVNAVRFSPCGKHLASGDDESAIIIWKQRQDSDAPELIAPGDSEAINKESWVALKILRGHLEDVYDICWSPDSASIISGSVDNTAIIWDVQKGSKVILDDHKGFVQGVAWDPKGQYIATLGSDRKMRVFSSSSKKLIARVGKAPLPVPKAHDLNGKNINLFHDDTIQTFFRRLCFSPDGEMIIAPSGVIEATEPGIKPSSTTLVFSRNLLTRPVCYLPSLDQYSVCVRCCPVLFELRNLDPLTKPQSMFLLPYRVVFAVATASAVVLYDTQQPMPFGYISNLHYTRLTDLAWSPKGDLLMVSSSDGFCSIITFSPGELGVPFDPKVSASSVSTEESKASSVKTKIDADLDKEISDSSDGVVCLDLSEVSLSEASKGESEATMQEVQEGNEKADAGVGHTENLKERSEASQTEQANAVNQGEERMSSSQAESADPMKVISSRSGTEEQKDALQAPATPTTKTTVTPGDSGKKARRVQLITLSSPKSKKKLL